MPETTVPRYSPRTAVRYVERQEDHWRVHYQWVESGQEKFDAPTMTVRAKVVILSAGTLGSTEILLRSHQNGLATSNMLGKHFSGNGDVLGFAYNTDRHINSIGYGDKGLDMFDPVGPCITGVIDLRGQDNLNDGMIIEEGVIPGALSVTLPAAFAVQAKMVGTDTAKSWADDARQFAREAESLIRGAYDGAMKNTQIYLVMTHDDANGEMYLQDDRLRIKWPGVGQQEIFKKVNENLIKVTEAHKGIFIKNLIWSEFFGHDLITVHPLGGCVMGKDTRCGVVNHKGQVFASPEGTQGLRGALCYRWVCYPQSGRGESPADHLGHFGTVLRSDRQGQGLEVQRRSALCTRPVCNSGQDRHPFHRDDERLLFYQSHRRFSEGL